MCYVRPPTTEESLEEPRTEWLLKEVFVTTLGDVNHGLVIRDPEHIAVTPG